MRLFVCSLLLALLAVPAMAGDPPGALNGFEAQPAETFDRRTVFKAIDGAAEIFLAYGFEQLHLRRYSRAGLTIEVSVYEMSSPLAAFGVFARERPPKAVEVAGPTGLSAAPWQCLLLKGPAYVKVGAMKGKLDAPTCTAVLTALAEGLPGDSNLPVELKRLPTEGRLPDSEGYTRQAYLGLGELSDCVHARYRVGDRELEVFAPLGPPDEVWQKLAAKWKPAGGAKPPVLVRKVPYRGIVAAVRTEAGILGAADADEGDVAPATLREIAAQ